MNGMNELQENALHSTMIITYTNTFESSNAGRQWTLPFTIICQCNMIIRVSAMNSWRTKKGRPTLHRQATVTIDDTTLLLTYWQYQHWNKHSGVTDRAHSYGITTESRLQHIKLLNYHYFYWLFCVCIPKSQKILLAPLTNKQLWQ